MQHAPLTMSQNTMSKIAKKHGAIISSLFNTIRCNELMQRAIAEGEGGALPFSYWQQSSIDAARVLRDDYAIEVPGYTKLLTGY